MPEFDKPTCIACKKPLTGLGCESSVQSYDAVMFSASGNYGSTVFDPMDGSMLVINVCDTCLVQHAQSGGHTVMLASTAGAKVKRQLKTWQPPG